MIKTIVVPTDGSDHANKAVELAADIASKYQARLVLVHALMRHTSESEIEALFSATTIPADLQKKLEDLREAQLDMVASSYEGGVMFLPVPEGILKEVADIILAEARRKAEGKGVKDIAVSVVDGDAAKNIVAAAEHEKADMIVMGSRGLGDLAGLFLGSVSHKVSHLANCTCITVK